MWDVETTDEFDEWWETLDDQEQDAVIAAAEVLKERGPALRRPLVDTVKQSRHANMKELIVPRRHIRILFAFDPQRTAILLIGGDKTGEWDRWYNRMVPIADDLFDQHLAKTERGRPRGR